MTLDNSYRDCLGRLDIAIQVIFTTELVLGQSLNSFLFFHRFGCG